MEGFTQVLDEMLKEISFIRESWERGYIDKEQYRNSMIETIYRSLAKLASFTD